MLKKEEKPEVEQNQKLVGSTEQPSPEEAGETMKKESIWDKVTGFAQKGLETIKNGAEKVSQMADDATKLGKIKYEIYSLKNERQSLLQQAGEKIWMLHQEKQPELVDAQLGAVYGQYSELAAKIDTLEAEAASINLTE